MKLNEWTMALAALGAVSLGSVAQAAEPAGNLATLSSTTLSGYVDTSAQWNLGEGDSHAPAYKYGGPAKADGFNLNAIKLTLERPLDEAVWAAGYKVDLFLGPDANTLGTTSTGTGADFAIKQAYVVTRVPIGTGLDFKIGVFDSIIGYESTESVNNPNFTRSWGHTFEPSTHTGVLGTYRIGNLLAFSAGLANTVSPTINGRANPPAAESYKSYMTAMQFTAPDDWDFLAGSSLYAGVVNGWLARLGAPQQNYYAGLTLNTPVTGLKVGASFDYNNTIPVAFASLTNSVGLRLSGVAAHSWAGYISFQATEKLSFHSRFEYAELSGSAASAAQGSGAANASAAVAAAGGGLASSVFSYTGTIQYDLWKNVLSRLEFRWDHALDGTEAFGGSTASVVTASGHDFSGTAVNSYEIIANIIYKF